MNINWFDELNELEEFAKESNREDRKALAENNPEEWLREQLEKDTDQSYNRIDERNYRAVSIKNGSFVKTDVRLDDEGFLRISSVLDVIATEETEAAFRLLQMYENATFKTAGYLPAKAGEPVVFEVRMRPDGDLDVGKLVKHCSSSAAMRTDKFKDIRNGRSVVDICDNDHKAKIKTAFSLFGH